MTILGGRAASKIGSSTSIAAVMQTRSRTVEMLSGLSLPLAFAMNTRLIGSGRYVSSLSASASSVSHSRAMPAHEIERLCEIVAAMKIRTTNRKGRHLSTVRVLELLEKHGVETPDGFLKLERGRITASTLNRHLSRLGYDHKRMIR